MGIIGIPMGLIMGIIGDWSILGGADICICAFIIPCLAEYIENASVTDTLAICLAYALSCSFSSSLVEVAILSSIMRTRPSVLVTGLSMS